ncbi:MAG TPA: type II secretion system secretin GspD, partial [Albitalea sp.]|nr:type II secretion system secretin GspD [Albitalea sp.]
SSGDIEVIPLKHAVAADIATLVQRMTDSGGAPGAVTPGTPAGGAGAASVQVDARSNSLLVRAANPARMASIRSLIDKLDRPVESAGAAGNVWVVYLKNADAVRLATVLRAAYGAGGSASTGGATGGATATQPTTTTPGSTTTGASAQATSPVAQSAGPSTGGFVQADPATNSLIITAPEPMYRQLRAVIDQLDSRRAQVYIESMIIKVDATKAAEFGFQWQGPLNSTSNKNIVVAGTNYNVNQNASNNIITLAAGAATGNLTQPGTGLNVGLVSKIAGEFTLTALARFLETNADGNVLSTPNLVTLDNEEAKIVIGQNVPFITGSFTNTGSTGSVNPFQTIERKDVGLTLRIKPQVGEGGTVRMTIYQENSSVTSTSSTAGPTTDKSAIETNVVIDDGQVMVLGGLLKDEYSGGVSKVPLLGDIPIIGNLFKTDSRQRVKSNLMVFLRPIIVRTQDAANTLTVDRYDAIRALQQGTQPARSVLVPVNESPIVPPLNTLLPPAAPASAPAPVQPASAPK